MSCNKDIFFGCNGAVANFPVLHWSVIFQDGGSNGLGALTFKSWANWMRLIIGCVNYRNHVICSSSSSCGSPTQCQLQEQKHRAGSIPWRPQQQRIQVSSTSKWPYRAPAHYHHPHGVTFSSLLEKIQIKCLIGLSFGWSQRRAPSWTALTDVATCYDDLSCIGACVAFGCVGPSPCKPVGWNCKPWATLI